MKETWIFWKSFRESAGKFLGRLVKKVFAHVQKNNLRKKDVSFSENFKIDFLFGLWVKNSLTSLRKNFKQGCQNYILRDPEELFEKTCLEKNYIFFLFFLESGQKLIKFWQKKSAECQNYVSRGTFWKKIYFDRQVKKRFYSVSGRGGFRISQNCFSIFYITVFYVSSGTFWKKMSLFWRVVSIQFVSGNQTKKLLDLGRRLSTTL